MSNTIIRVQYIGCDSVDIRNIFSDALAKFVPVKAVSLDWNEVSYDNLIEQIEAYVPNILVCDFDDPRTGGLSFIQELARLKFRSKMFFLGGGQPVSDWVPYNLPLPDYIFTKPYQPDLSKLVGMMIVALAEDRIQTRVD